MAHKNLSYGITFGMLAGAGIGALPDHRGGRAALARP